jgi:hypothetical protein
MCTYCVQSDERLTIGLYRYDPNFATMNQLDLFRSMCQMVDIHIHL